MTRKTGFYSTALGLAFLAGTILIPSGTALGRDRDDHDCRQRIEHQEHKLHEAIEHHGQYSRQADRARDRLREVRERCEGRGYYGDRDHEHDRDRGY